jgi:hypothetical protein
VSESSSARRAKGGLWGAKGRRVSPGHFRVVGWVGEEIHKRLDEIKAGERSAALAALGLGTTFTYGASIDPALMETGDNDNLSTGLCSGILAHDKNG